MGPVSLLHPPAPLQFSVSKFVRLPQLQWGWRAQRVPTEEESQDYSGATVLVIPGILRLLELFLGQRLSVLTGHAVYSHPEGQTSLWRAPVGLRACPPPPTHEQMGKITDRPTAGECILRGSLARLSPPMLPLSVLRAVPDLMRAWKGMAVRLAGAWGADPPRPWAKTQGPRSIRGTPGSLG